MPAGDPLEGERRLRRRARARRTRPSIPARSIPSGACVEPSAVPVASSPIAAQAYARRGRRLSPSLANRLRIGFAICFAVLTAMAVIGVARFIQERQDFESSIERSYQVEMVGPGAAGRRSPPRRGPRRDRRPAEATASSCRTSISTDTRNTALLVAAGIIAGLTGALLLFSGLIASMRRPLEELVAAAGRLAAGDRSARVEVGGLSETATLGAAFNEMADGARTRGQPARPARPDERRVRAHRLARAAQPADLGAGIRRAADAGAREAQPAAGRDGRDHPRQLAATWCGCSTTCSTWRAATPGG